MLAWIGNFLGLLNFVLKCEAGVTFMVWVRWTLPRLRIDQVMQVCLKYCTPLAAVMFLGATLWTFVLPGGVGLRSQPYASHYRPAIIAVPVPDEAEDNLAHSVPLRRAEKTPLDTCRRAVGQDPPNRMRNTMPPRRQEFREAIDLQRIRSKP